MATSSSWCSRLSLSVMPLRSNGSMVTASSVEEIAGMLDLTVAAAQSLPARARNEFKQRRVEGGPVVTAPTTRTTIRPPPVSFRRHGGRLSTRPPMPASVSPLRRSGGPVPAKARLDAGAPLVCCSPSRQHRYGAGGRSGGDASCPPCAGARRSYPRRPRAAQPVGSRSSAPPRCPLPTGENLTTITAALVKVNGGGTLRIAPNSQIRVTAMDGITLQAGEIYVDLPLRGARAFGSKHPMVA